MKFILTSFIIWSITANAQYIQEGISWNTPIKQNYVLNETSFKNSDGLITKVENIDSFTELKGFDIKMLGIFNYKRFFYKIDFNIFSGYENFKLTHVSEKVIEKYPEDLIYLDTITLELDNEYVSIGNEFMFKLTKQPNSFYISFQHLFMINNYHAGSVAKNTEIEMWLTNVKKDVRINFGFGYKMKNAILFSKYTPQFRTNNNTRAISFSKLEVGFAFLGKPKPLFKKQSLYQPKN